MAGKLISFISYMMCGIPFLIIGIFSKDSKDPIGFWSGDQSLKGKVKNVSEYNKEMASLYKRYSIVLIATAFVSLINVIAGIILITFDITVGIVIVYRRYKKILNRYSE